MTNDEMKALVRQHFEDFVDRRDLGAADRNFALTFIDHDGPGHRTVGVAEDEAMLAGMHRQFPNLRVEIDDVIAVDDRVVGRNVWQGTDASTNRKIVFTGIVIWRIEGGRVPERWASVQPPTDDTANAQLVAAQNIGATPYKRSVV